MNNLTLAYVNTMASQNGARLVARHYEILEYAFQYYRRHRVGPLYQNIRKHTGADRSEIERLFPHGLQSIYSWTKIPVYTPETGCKPIAVADGAPERETYLDYNSTTPIREEVDEALTEFYRDPWSFGNPSASNAPGARAYESVEEARRRIANVVGVDPREIYFTGNGTESNNLAILGLARAKGRGSVVYSTTEHPSAIRTVESLAKEGFEPSPVAPTSEGIVEPTAVERALRDDAILVVVMSVNNELGTIQPVEEIGELCRARGVAFHMDAAQSFGKMPTPLRSIGATTATFSAHKIYGPKGVGALYVAEGTEIAPISGGGDQERGLRPGTVNAAGAMAFGVAAELAEREREAETARLRELRDRFLAGVHEIDPEAVVNGSLERRLPNNLNVGFPDVDGGSLLLSLNAVGVYVSAGSACSAGSQRTSHVLDAIGADSEKYGSIRFGFGARTTEEDVDYAIDRLSKILGQLREHRL